MKTGRSRKELKELELVFITIQIIGMTMLSSMELLKHLDQIVLVSKKRERMIGIEINLAIEDCIVEAIGNMKTLISTILLVLHLT